MIDQEYECYCDDCESNGVVPLDYPQWKLLQGKVGNSTAFDINSGAEDT